MGTCDRSTDERSASCLNSFIQDWLNVLRYRAGSIWYSIRSSTARPSRLGMCIGSSGSCYLLTAKDAASKERICLASRRRFQRSDWRKEGIVPELTHSRLG